MIKNEMTRRNQVQLFLRTLILTCVALNPASLGGSLLQVSPKAADHHPLSRRELSAYSMPRDAIAARGHSFSLKVCKSQRPQLDQETARKAPKLVFHASRIEPVLAFPLSHSYRLSSQAAGRAPPRLA
ncbi:MAG TPA: hypothetical protein VNS63_19285 [Blastocatellia bacterium]|nr:hypothetical protein [Blastocatellia bacterium]